MGENDGLKVTVKEYNTIPGRPPGMPCIAFDYKSGSAPDRMACPAQSGRQYELRESRTGKLVTTLRYTRPDSKTVRVAVSGRLLDGGRGIRWQAYLEGSGDAVADQTRWRVHNFPD